MPSLDIALGLTAAIPPFFGKIFETSISIIRLRFRISYFLPFSDGESDNINGGGGGGGGEIGFQTFKSRPSLTGNNNNNNDDDEGNDDDDDEQLLRRLR